MIFFLQALLKDRGIGSYDVMFFQKWSVCNSDAYPVLFFCLFTYLSIYLSARRSFYLLACPLFVPSSSNSSVLVSIYPPPFLSIDLSVNLPAYVSSFPIVSLSSNLFIHLSVYLSICPSSYPLPIYLSSYSPVYLSVYVLLYLPNHLSISFLTHLKICLPRQKYILTYSCNLANLAPKNTEARPVVTILKGVSPFCRPPLRGAQVP